MDDFIFTAEVARLLGKSAETVRLYERLGRLPAIRTGNGVRLFRRADVLRFSESITPKGDEFVEVLPEGIKGNETKSDHATDAI